MLSTEGVLSVTNSSRKMQQDIFLNEVIVVPRAGISFSWLNEIVPLSNYQIVISTGSLWPHFNSSLVIGQKKALWFAFVCMVPSRPLGGAQ